jgi:hypothetical protein
MKAQACRGQRLAEYVDGELSGTEMLHVSRHLEQCPTCDEEAAAMRQMGDMLRHAVHPEPQHELAGLASSVVSRISAERAVSWRAMFDRAVEDWHWFFVGFGSVTAAFISITLVSAVLHFGPAPEREDSVAALLSNPDWRVMNSQDGSMYVWATPVRPNDWRILLTSRERAEAAAATNGPASISGLETEQDLVGAIENAFTRSGESIDLNAMSPDARSHAEALFRRLIYLRGEARTIPALGHDDQRSMVYRMQFVTNTEVTAKGL